MKMANDDGDDDIAIKRFRAGGPRGLIANQNAIAKWQITIGPAKKCGESLAVTAAAGADRDHLTGAPYRAGMAREQNRWFRWQN